jgi:hypothetical protein
MSTTFMGEEFDVCNINAVGDLLEDVFFRFIHRRLPDFEEGPRQASPDFYGGDKAFHFEQKVFNGSPGFDIANFNSYVDQLAAPNGVQLKLFNTKYLIYEYEVDGTTVKIKAFHYLDVWKLPNYDGKWPMSAQVKRGMWYNLRPGPVSGWNSPEKTPQLFIEKLIESIRVCPHIENKDSKIESIQRQFTEARI